MIIIRDLWDIDNLKRRILQGDILEIYNIQYDVAKYYWVYEDILTASMADGDWADYCYDGEFHNDLRIALLDPTRYLIKLVIDSNMGCTEVVRLEEGAATISPFVVMGCAFWNAKKDANGENTTRTQGGRIMARVTETCANKINDIKNSFKK